jgi:uncharacterized protein YnzC (UPF0291/DUF896 family)
MKSVARQCKRAIIKPATEDCLMISKEMLNRINELAKKSREEGLTDCECAEQKELRAQYAAACRERLRDVIDNTVIQKPDGTKHKIPKKD